MKAIILACSAAALAIPCNPEVSPRDGLASALTADLPVIVASRNGIGDIDVESAIDIASPGADEIVDIGSVTKTVTAIAVLHLIENHDLTLGTTLSELLPGVPQDKAQITLHQLLTHTSGIVESTGDDGEALSRSDFLERVFDAPLAAKPGTLHLYSNAGYSVLAAIIEVQSGLNYEDYLFDLVLPEGSPAIGYARAYDAERAIRSNRSWLIGFQRRAVADASWGASEPGWNLIGNGGLVTSAEGFLAFWAAFLSGQIVGDTLVAEATTPHVDEGNGDTFYGYGMVVEPLEDGTHVFWHDGGNDIFSAEWRHLSRSGVTFFSAGQGEAAFDAMSLILSSVKE
ncbi:MAG: serine hydrolase domain-containing protein [Pseudomonadota bacterium]